jgi:hypothetical protein
VKTSDAKLIIIKLQNDGRRHSKISAFHRLTLFSRFFVARDGLNMVFYKEIRARVPSSNFERFYYFSTTFHGLD